MREEILIVSGGKIKAGDLISLVKLVASRANDGLKLNSALFPDVSVNPIDSNTSAKIVLEWEDRKGVEAVVKGV